MAMHQIVRVEDDLRYGRESSQEVDALFRDLLIGVTNFFRDPEAFKLLDEKVLKRLVANKAPHEPLRVWVCGCSTGEEAYSIAILLYEHTIAMKRVLKVQVFATDIDAQAIEQARSGVYPASIAAHVGEERLNRFFILDPQRSTYRVQKHIRDLVVFAEQDVIKDPPFSRLDLVTCRNLLIYLNSDLQRKLIPLFHYALAPGGTLFLGRLRRWATARACSTCWTASGSCTRDCRATSTRFALDGRTSCRRCPMTCRVIHARRQLVRR
jgi:two-component system CheB/CheR fusion protein